MADPIEDAPKCPRLITSVRAAKRELARVYRDFRAALIVGEDARTATYILRSIVETVKDAEFEQRLCDIERRQREQERDE